MAKTPATAQWSEDAASAAAAVQGRFTLQASGRYRLQGSGSFDAYLVQPTAGARHVIDPAATSGHVIRVIGAARAVLK